jgi:hypothetical protein
MKSIIKWLPIVLLILYSSCSYGQNDTSSDKATQMLREFYTSYNVAWSTTKDNDILIKKIDSLRRKYCTVALFNKLTKEFKTDGLDHDLLINDEYTDVQNIKTLNITKHPAKQDSYIVSYIDATLSPSYKPVKRKIILYVTVIKENGQYKISTVR